MKPAISGFLKVSALTVACLFAFTACNKSDHATQSDNVGLEAPKEVIEVTFWHSMSGELGSELNDLIKDFNKENPNIKVTGIYKGEYGSAMNAGIAAFRAKQAPDILQVFEVGTATMMYAKEAVKPVHEILSESGASIKTDDFIGAIAGYYSNQDGQLVSMPFNSSTAVLYYNKDLFKKAGLNPEKPPKTYTVLKEFTKKLKDSGVHCGYTTAWPAWILLETASSWHNVEYASHGNGFGGLEARLKIDTPFFKRIIGDIGEMSRDGLFTYGGRGESGIAQFVSGQCAILTDSSSSLAQIKSDSKFNFGIGKLPYYDDISGAPQNSVVGGASLWVFSGKTPEQYKAIGTFLDFLAKPETMAKWHQKTGYLPVTKASYELSKKSGFYAKNPGSEIAIEQLNISTSDHSKGIRLGSLPEIREIEESEMEKVFNGKATVEQAVGAIQKRSDEILSKFEKTNK